MVAFIRSLARSSRNGARMTNSIVAQSLPRTTVATNPFSTSAYRLSEPPSKESTHSEAAVHAEKHDLDPKELQEKTAREAQDKHDTTSKSASPNDNPTHSEDSVHADRHAHDPLPDHKKSSSNKK